MFKRTRDVIRKFKPLGHITYEEWQDISDRHAIAKKFLVKTNSIYMLFKVDLKKAEDIVLENRVHKVHDEKTITDYVKKIFITPKQEQLDELVGQIKYLRGLLKELNSWVDRKKDLEKQEADGKITIQREEVERDEKK